MLRLESDRVVLRPVRPDELDRVIDARAGTTGSVVSSGVDAQKQALEHSGEWSGGRLNLAIESDGRLVGTIQARGEARFAPPGVCEIGIVLFDGERGKGVGSEAVRLFAEWLLENGYPRVQATTDLRNAPMRRVLEKLGFAEEGVLRAFMPDGDGRADYVLYARTR